MKTDILFIHRQLAFAVSIKQALERTGTYDVHPFTSVEAAMEYLRGHTQDVALVDFMMPVYSGEEIVERLREVQPQITVVATPTQTEGEFARLGLHGMLPANFTAREFMPAVERALEGRRTGELPQGRGAGLLGHVQDDEEKRPPTSVIGYRSLESILDEGAGVTPAQPTVSAEDATLVGDFAVPTPEEDALPDAATLLEALPAVSSADDLSFLDDVLPPPPRPTPLEPGMDPDHVVTAPLDDDGLFQSNELPEHAPDLPVSTQPLTGTTGSLPETPTRSDAPPVPSPAPLAPGMDPLNVVTDRLSDTDPFKSDELPPLAPELQVRTEPLGLTTEPLAPLDAEAAPAADLFAGFDAEAFGADYGTRPLSEIDAEEAAARLAEPRSAEFEAPGFVLPGLIEEEEAEPAESYGGFAAPAPAFPPAFEQPGFESGDPFAGYGDEEPAEQPVDYMAFLDLQPATPTTAGDAPPWLTDEPAPAPAGPSEEEMYAGLQALFSSGEAPAAEAAADSGEFSFDDLPAEAAENEEFAGVLGEIDPDAAGSRQRSEFDDLVASMSAPEQRPPLPTRQQQYVDVSLTDDMSSLLEQFEQVRTGGEGAESDEALDLSAVLFVEDEEDARDTPPKGIPPVEEPALASPEELAALFGAPRPTPATPPYEDFEALLTESGQAQEPATGDEFGALFGDDVAPEAPEGPHDQEFESVLASFNAPSEPQPPDYDWAAAEAPSEPSDPDVNAVFATAPEPDLESLFPLDEPAEAADVDFAAMFGAENSSESGPFETGSEPAEADLDVFGGDWGAGDVLALDQEPRFEETGTVSDLMTGVEEVTGGSGRTGMLTRLTGPLPPIAPDRPERAPQDTSAAPPPIDDTVTALLAEIEMQLAAAPPPPIADIDRAPLDESGDTPARRILETTSEAEQTDSSFSVQHLLDNIEAQLPPNKMRVQPLPSWVRPPAPAPSSLPEMDFSEQTVLHQPPDFSEETVPHGAPPVEAEPPFDWDSATFDETTQLGQAARAEQSVFTGDEETSWLEYIEPEAGESMAAETLVAAAAVAGVAGVAAAVQPPATDAEWEAVEAEAAEAARAMQAEHIDDPYIAQLALSLTDVSLELTADAILLTRGRDIAAFAGRMSRDELLELRAVIDDDWEAAANDARIRFLRLPESGKDVMLYSRRTVEDLTLSLVFDGAMPLRDIRLQGKRLMDALAAVPEAPVEIVLPPPPPEEESADDSLALSRSPHAFVWLLRDPEGALARPVAQAIVTGLNQQITQHGWRVREMRASEDHVYLLADSPDEQPPYMAVRELMRRSAQIAHVQNPSLDARTLWAEAYLVVTPGRSLEADEIQQFIQFERML